MNEQFTRTRLAMQQQNLYVAQLPLLLAQLPLLLAQLPLLLAQLRLLLAQQSYFISVPSDACLFNLRLQLIQCNVRHDDLYLNLVECALFSHL